MPDPSDLALHIERIGDLPPEFSDIIAMSLQEGFAAMQRMREDWDSGDNRFDGPGEALFEARVGSRLVGICGINRDPYTQTPGVGRVRHLYIHPGFRRRGIGRLLVTSVVEHSHGTFSRLRLRTLRADADQFYVAIGFRRVVGERHATHALEGVPSGGAT